MYEDRDAVDLIFSAGNLQNNNRAARQSCSVTSTTFAASTIGVLNDTWGAPSQASSKRWVLLVAEPPRAASCDAVEHAKSADRSWLAIPPFSRRTRWIARRPHGRSARRSPPPAGRGTPAVTLEPEPHPRCASSLGHPWSVVRWSTAVLQDEPFSQRPRAHRCSPAGAAAAIETRRRSARSPRCSDLPASLSMRSRPHGGQRVERRCGRGRFDEGRPLVEPGRGVSILPRLKPDVQAVRWSTAAYALRPPRRPVRCTHRTEIVRLLAGEAQPARTIRIAPIVVARLSLSVVAVAAATRVNVVVAAGAAAGLTASHWGGGWILPRLQHDVAGASTPAPTASPRRRPVRCTPGQE